MYGFSKQRSGVGSNMMQSYMEKQLMGLHNTSSSSISNYKDKVTAFFIGVFSLVFLPYFHLGAYEEPGTTRYKHVYFNSTWQSMRIWVVTVLFILMAYESIKYLIPLIRRRNIRASMFALYLVNVYPHYYSWWSYFSYYNEDFYRYFSHHMWFTVTEVITTCIVLNLCDMRNEIISWKILAIVSINIMHIFVGGMDQFIADVLYGKGHNFHKARNIGLMIPDMLHVAIPLWELYKFARRKELKISEICYKEEIFLCLLFVSMGTLIGNLL